MPLETYADARAATILPDDPNRAAMAAHEMRIAYVMGYRKALSDARGALGARLNEMMDWKDGSKEG